MHAFSRNVMMAPAMTSIAKSVTRLIPDKRLTVCGMSTVLNAAIGADSSIEPSAKPATSRLACIAVGLVPSGAVIGSRRSRKDDSRFGTATSRCAAAVRGAPPSDAMRAAWVSGRSLDASGIRGCCCTDSRRMAAFASGVRVFS